MPLDSRTQARPHDPQGSRGRRIGWWVVLVSYLAYFGLLLVATHGLPYSIDNNESFSSLWHARHMFELPFSETKGLANEVMAWHPAASPYVHTHQGNFPRLFAFLLYLLGARSIESQIILTTFTVGLAAIWFAYRLLCTIGPPLFATLGCLVLITDYALFGQWQVDTYRVWYGFFFFGSLFWVSQLGRFRKWPMFLAGFLLFAPVFYGEYVFAAFVGLTACGYAVFLFPRRPGILLRAGLAVACGGAAAAGVLLAQLVAYMGWQNVKLDIGYTLTARNMARDQHFQDMVDTFYRDHRIIFWNNYFDITGFRSVATFVTSLFEKHLQYYSPWVCLSAMVVLAGALAGMCRRDPPADSVDAAPAGGGSWVRFAATRVAPGIVLASFAVLALRYARPLFDESSGKLLQAALGIAPPAWAGWLAYVVASAVALAFAVAGTARLVGLGGGLPRLFSLSLCVVAAYAVVYRLFTGYIFSGYLVRQAPFLVFWTDILLAGALYLVLEASRRGFAHVAGRRGPRILAFAGALLLLLFAGTWTLLQVSYLVVVPPNGEPFLRLLSRAPFRGHTFVANDYPAPISEMSHAWAYANSSIFSGQVKLDAKGYSVEHDLHYLWFADGTTNKDYLKPDFGLLIDQPASISESLTEFADRKKKHERRIAFDSLGMIKRTQEPLQPFLRHELAGTDGHSYSIVKFDWDFPPFLRPVDSAVRVAAKSMTFQQKLSFSETSEEQRRRWRVEIEPAESTAADGRMNSPVLLKEASIDGRPVFSDNALAKAGWARSTNPKGGYAKAWTGTPGVSGKLSAVVLGDAVALRLMEGPEWGVAVVALNDMTQAIDLRRPTPAEHVIAMNTAEARDRYTTIPRLAPGTFVNTWLTSGDAGPAAVVGYSYAHQEGNAEEGTTVRVYNETTPGHWQLSDAISFLGPDGIPVRLDGFRGRNPDTDHEYARMRSLGETRTYGQWLTDHLEAHPDDRNRGGIVAADPSVRGFSAGPGSSPSQYRTIPLSPGLSGRVQISVTPSTRTKSGPEFFGYTFDAGQVSASRPGRFDSVSVERPKETAPRDLPYGFIHLRLRFPAQPLSGVEPIVSAGVEEAGDFVYVIYSDTTHVKIGFDHWFKGGPISPPIPVDYSKVHDLEISMGSLFPPEEDIVFVGMEPRAVANLKGNMWVKLDGKTAIEAPSEFWDSPPTQVAIGRNDIKGTTSSPIFSGEILSCKRVWPDLK